MIFSKHDKTKKDRAVYSTDGVGETGYPHANNEAGPLPYTVYKTNSKIIRHKCKV
jgi:hypothetical protein